MSAFPIDDWQFWVVTGAAMVAAWWLLRGLLPRSLGGKRKRRGRRTTLTVGGRAVDR